MGEGYERISGTACGMLLEMNDRFSSQLIQRVDGSQFLILTSAPGSGQSFMVVSLLPLTTKDCLTEKMATLINRVRGELGRKSCTIGLRKQPLIS